MLAQYNLALAYYDWSQMKDSSNSGLIMSSSKKDALKVAQSWFKRAGEQGHDLSCYNAGVLSFNQKSLSEAMSWFGRIEDPQIIERHSISDLMDLYKRRGTALIVLLNEEGANNYTLALDRADEIVIQSSGSLNINKKTD